MTRGVSSRQLALALLTVLVIAGPARAQVVSERGFVDATVDGFFQEATNDRERAVGDLLAREEVFINPTGWLQLAGGIDFRANSHDQIDDEWRLDWEDRGLKRPRLALRRLSASFLVDHFTLDLGKQFIRWGRADLIYPTDRFAPRDYLNVLDTEVLPVIAARAALQFGSESIEAIVTPQMTPSRLPLLDQRWSPLPEEARALPIDDVASVLPDRAQYGVRWRHTGTRIESALAYFDGPTHLPNVEVRPEATGALEVRRVFPVIRMLGGDLAIPTSWLTWKIEAAYVTAPEQTTEEYALYVLEIERQVGEWLIAGGYAGDVTTESHPTPTFNPDRSMARSLIGRVAYTVDPRRTVVVEAAVRQSGDGVFGRAEYSQSFGQHLRLTLSGVAIRGEQTNFIGQYRDNSHLAAGLRFSF